jgi:hypothetical protein
MTKLVSGMPAPQFGDEPSCECEDQSWFKVEAVPVFRFDWWKMFSHTPVLKSSGLYCISSNGIGKDLEGFCHCLIEVPCRQLARRYACALI